MPRGRSVVPRQTGSMLCPSCRKLIAVDEPRCPFCGALRPGLWGWGPVLQRFFGSALDLVPVLIGACAIVYAAGLLLDLGGALRGGGSLLALLSPSRWALYRLGMTGGWAKAEGHWWTVLTAIYLHGGILHLALNMLAFRNLGAEAQELFGKARFFVLFTLSGAGGFLLSNALSAHATVGASGAILGLVGARLAFARRRGGALGQFVSRQTLQWVGMLLVFGFLMPGIDNAAHVGGFAVGFVLGRRLPAAWERPEGRRMHFLALALVAVTLVGFALSFLRGPVLAAG